MNGLVALLITLNVHAAPAQERVTKSASTARVQDSLPLEADPDRDLKYCGVQAVCIVSHLYGKPIDFDRVLGEIPVGDRGSSLGSMERFLKRNGLRFEAVLADPRLLQDVKKPFIAHIETNVEEGTGHYVLVLSSRDGVVLFLDPSQRLYGRTDAASFAPRLTRGRLPLLVLFRLAGTLRQRMMEGANMPANGERRTGLLPPGRKSSIAARVLGLLIAKGGTAMRQLLGTAIAFCMAIGSMAPAVHAQEDKEKDKVTLSLSGAV